MTDDPIEIGRIESIWRYPVKSMRGVELASAKLGWHGIEGDRRLALRRTRERGAFPWLSASALPGLVCYAPMGAEDEAPPTHVRTPAGEDLPALGEGLAAEIAQRFGAPVEMMAMKHGVFDDGTVSVITSTTTGELCRLGGVPADVRRFRPNVVLRSVRAEPFEEDAWLGGTLEFGDAADGAAVAVTTYDVRCAMIKIDPDTGQTTAAVLKAAVRANDNNAGVYATVTRAGRIAVGQRVMLRRP